MNIVLNLHILENYPCLEPEAGEELLPLYPEFLSDEDNAAFEAHREICQSCQEHWKLWQASGLAIRAETFLTYAEKLLEKHRHEEAVAAYNKALLLDPGVAHTQEGDRFLLSGAWLPLTAARSKQQDIFSYIAPNYTPGAVEMNAAKALSPFPIVLEYAGGKVKGKIFAIGRLIFFELLEANEEFEAGIQLVGGSCRPSVEFIVWSVIPGKKCRLGTAETLFGTAGFADVVKSLRSFRVLPKSSSG